MDQVWKDYPGIRDLLPIIESYIPLEDLGDEERGKRIRRIAWCLPAGHKEDECTTAFEDENMRFLISHVGNYLRRIYYLPLNLYSQQESVYPEILWSQSEDSPWINIHWFRQNMQFYESSNGYKLMDLDDKGEGSFGEFQVLKSSVYSIVYRVQRILRRAEIIVSHLHFLDKYPRSVLTSFKQQEDDFDELVE